MAVKKGGLGRGLDSLFTDSGSTVSAPSTLKISEIEPDIEQPRKVFTDEALHELSQSIQEHGILQPIAVRPNPMGGYKIIAGERRWRAARLAGLTEMPAIVKEVSDEQAMELALIENLQREDLDPVEEAEGYKNLIEKCNYTQEQAAKKLSKSRSAIANSLRILVLPKEILEYIQKGELSHGHAKVILGIENDNDKVELAQEIVRNKLSVRDAEVLCKKLKSKNQTKTKAKQVIKPSFPTEVELSLKETLGTEVGVKYKDGKGILNINFYSDEQLKAFANLLGKYNKEKNR